MSLQENLMAKFISWQPSAPEVVTRTKRDITMSWQQDGPFGFLGDQLLYRVEKNNKLPEWIVVYSGGKTTKTIDNLAPRHPHKFRLKVILKDTAVPKLADVALEFYGDENTIYDTLGKKSDNLDGGKCTENFANVPNGGNEKENGGVTNNKDNNLNASEDIQSSMECEGKISERKNIDDKIIRSLEKRKWIESQWSEETWTSTATDGTSPVCFCMAVKYGYLKQVQVMAEERPELIDTVNANNGLTPLATAIRIGDINTVRLLLTLGAQIDTPSAAGQTPLHLAVLAGDIGIVDLLIEKGADVLARDWNGLRMEHYAVESCNLDMLKLVLDKGGDVKAKDYNGWTPLFRALCQGAKTEIIEELVTRGSDVNDVDHAGLPLTSVAKILKNRHGRTRDSVVRLVDCQYPHDKALANFTRLTKKIYNVHTIIKMN